MQFVRSVEYPAARNESDSTAFDGVERRVNRSAQLTKDTPSAARWAEQPNRSYIISTTRAGHTEVGSNQIDSEEACLARTGTSEINDSPSRVNPPAPICPHRFRENVE